MGSERLIVIGGDAAGMSAASKAKRENPDLEVIVFEKQNYVSFGLCGLPYYISGMVEDLDDLIAVSPQEFEEKRNIDMRINHEVIDINPNNKTTIVLNEEGNETEMSYNKLLIATGAHARVPSLDGIDLENVFTLHWLKDGKKIKNFIERENPQKVAVTAGYIGLEMAEAFKKLGLDVTVLAKYNQLLPMVDNEIMEPLEKELKENEVNVQKYSEITGFEGNKQGELEKVITKKGELEVDFTILSVGVEPTVNLAEKAGVEIGESGGIVVNEQMKTNIEDIYAAGDCVESEHLITGKGVNIPLGDTANRQGRIAGTNIAGGEATFPGLLGTAITKVFDLGITRTGLSKREAEKSDFEFMSSTITDSSNAFYYPDGAPITIKLIVEEETGRLLGAQMVGKEGVSQRIDVFASLIYNENTVQKIQNLDLAYAPPYAPAWDPIQTAAKVATSKLKK